jgi:hypothetical protein
MSDGGSANGDFLGVVQRNMAALTDDELLRVVTIEAQDYRKEAIDIAWAELRRRGIDAPSPQEIVRIEQRSAEDQQNAPLRQLRWLKFYTFVIAADSAAALYSFIRDVGQISVGWLAFRSCQLGLLCFLLPGMIRRKAWAYYLNWLYIALTVYTLAARWSTSRWALPVFFSIWAVPNFIYFRKRRRLFLRP